MDGASAAKRAVIFAEHLAEEVLKKVLAGLLLILSIYLAASWRIDKILSNRPDGHIERPAGEYTSDWFSMWIPEWSSFLKPFAGKPGIKALEVGCYEGMASVWLLTNILTAPDAGITVIDPFDAAPSLPSEEGDKKVIEVFPSLNMGEVEKRFDRNIEATGVSGKVRKIKGFSQEELRHMPANSFDIIYIDGSHVAKDVLTDAVLSWGLLRTGGIMIFDDYDFDGYGTGFSLTGSEFGRPPPAVDSFLRVFGPYVEVLHKEYQVFIKKDRELLPAHMLTKKPSFLERRWREIMLLLNEAEFIH